MAALHGSLSRLVQAVNEESQARFELRFVVVCSIVARQVRAIPGEDAELALPGAVADGPQRSKIAPVVRRMLLAAVNQKTRQWNFDSVPSRPKALSACFSWLTAPGRRAP